MKVVLNNSGDYFDPSPLLMVKLVEAKAEIIRSWTDSLNQEAIEEATLIKFGDIICDEHGIETGYSMHSFLQAIQKDGQIYDIDWKDKSRIDPDLVRLVEELGPLANASGKPLYIIEIPDDIEWYIEDNYGHEIIREVTRIWDWTGLIFESGKLFKHLS